ncbi:uncharacterized protein LOC113360344 [Papaver somniferum]|uniref:uncharacterized protein LOC113360344 n=1 Tax=Papaver somniferum TaxID=3469 RepID=UPI000E6FABE3|nr:uncharacterized protein LOC113360344 [Papaver somniferum]
MSLVISGSEIAKAWEKEVHGSPGFKLLKKLQFTRIALSKWNKAHFSDINQKVDMLRHQLNEIQQLPHSAANTSKAFEVNEELKKWHRIQHDFHKQKSRDNFLKDMNNNTKEDLSNLLTKHFKEISTTTSPVIQEQYYNLLSTVITNEDNRLLLISPTNDEIFKNLKSMDNWLAPVPEGFQAGFFLKLNGIQLVQRSLNVAHLSKEIKGIKAARRTPPINHLLFADDCLIFTQANLTSVNNLKQLPHDFNSQSGQVINFDKSSILFNNNMDHDVCNTLKNILGVNYMDKNEKYLGLHFLLEDLKLSSWNIINLGQAGRTTMVKSLLYSVPLYQMSTFKNPKKLIKKLDSQRIKFWWGHKGKRGTKFISWQKLCIPKDLGGLAFKDLEMMNHALLKKLAWGISNQEDQLVTQMDSKPTPRDPCHLSYNLVNELILPDSAAWNVPLLNTLFPSEVVDKIKLMIISPIEKDVVRWKPTKDGIFTVNSAYNNLVEHIVNRQAALSTVPKNTWKDLWKMKLPHTIKLFIWKC